MLKLLMYYMWYKGSLQKVKAPQISKHQLKIRLETYWLKHTLIRKTYLKEHSDKSLVKPVFKDSKVIKFMFFEPWQKVN